MLSLQISKKSKVESELSHLGWDRFKESLGFSYNMQVYESQEFIPNLIQLSNPEQV